MEESNGRRKNVISESSSDEDIPLSSLKSTLLARKESITPVATAEKHIVENGSSVVSSSNLTTMSESSSNKRDKDALTEDSDDDEVPLVKLAKKGDGSNVGSERSTVVKTQTTPMTKQVVVKKEKFTPIIKKEKSSDTTAKEKKAEENVKIDFRQQECSESLYGCDKGRLVQEILCRWWYAIEWPPVADTHQQVPSACQVLDGFPGAFIRVKGDDMGSILDLRSSVGKPTFINLFSKPAEELKDLLLKAYRNQMKVLVAHEGEDAPLLVELKKAMSSAEKINTERADKKAKKRLKQWRSFKDQIFELCS